MCEASCTKPGSPRVLFMHSLTSPLHSPAVVTQLVLVFVAPQSKHWPPRPLLPAVQDVHSFAVVLYELLTWQPPFAGVDNPWQVSRHEAELLPQLKATAPI